jgi:hypothetical protein
LPQPSLHIFEKQSKTKTNQNTKGLWEWGWAYLGKQSLFLFDAYSVWMLRMEVVKSEGLAQALKVALREVSVCRW